nr:hypothetical protein [Tanacetum cinerariifolium]
MAPHRQMGFSFQAAIVLGKESGRILVLSKDQITLWGKPSRANQGRKRKGGVEVAATLKLRNSTLTYMMGPEQRRLQKERTVRRESYADIKVVERETKDLAFHFNIHMLLKCVTLSGGALH